MCFPTLMDAVFVQEDFEIFVRPRHDGKPEKHNGQPKTKFWNFE